MEPQRITDPALLGIQEELKAREPIFHRPELGTAREDFERMTVADFWEVGASGRRYSRACVLEELERRRKSGNKEEPLQAGDFHCRQLAEDLYLLTYTLLQGEKTERRTRRSTIWQKVGSEWKIVFHQGTVVQDEGLR
jgi:hypothetical protein